MKAIIAAVLMLMIFDVAFRHGVELQDLGHAVAAFFHSIGDWVYA